MKVAYIGNYQCHGDAIANIGTTMSYLISNFIHVSSVDVYCPYREISCCKEVELKKVRIKKQYNKEISWSILKLFTVKWNEYNFIVINSLPTSYGRGSLINFFGMLLPLFIVRLKRGKVALIYHNSTLTNDTVKLGYSGIINGFKRILLRKVEILTDSYLKNILIN